MKRFLSDLTLPAAVAGFVGVMIGLTSSGAIIFQAAQKLGANQAQINSWMWALGLGMGIASLVPSLWYRRPLLAAWSTPGAALIVTGGNYTLAEATGAFIVSSLLIIVTGATGLFERMMNRVPLAIAGALLAGVLLRFCLDLFPAAQSAPWLVGTMCVTHLLGRRLWPRYVIVVNLMVGIAFALASGRFSPADVSVTWATPVWVSPGWSLGAVIGLAIPLYIVTMASQNIPGVAAIRQFGYDTPISPALTWQGLVNLVLAPFGAFALNFAAITAAIGMSPDVHPDKERRYTASVMAGFFYIGMGLIGGIVGTLFAALPKELIVTIAALALIMTVGNGLAGALQKEEHREAAMVTFLMTTSGVSFFNIGSAFWGLVVGLGVMVALRRRA